MSDESDRLIQARRAAGYHSAADAARALHVPYPTYAGQENGSRGFRARAARYARFYRVRLEWLLTGKGSMKEGKKPAILEAFEELPSDKQREAIDFISFLKQRQ